MPENFEQEEGLTEKQFEDRLHMALDRFYQEMQEEGIDISWVQSFKSHGMLTLDNGLVIQLKDGSQFALTIQRRS